MKVQRVNGTIFADTFFALIKSVRGFKCWNLYCYQKSGIDIPCLQAQRSQGYVTLLSCLNQHGIPVSINTDNAPEFESSKWNKILNKIQIEAEFTEVHHPNQNLAKRRSGIVKLGFIGASMLNICLLRSVLAKESLNWRTLNELHWGYTPDISIFKYMFWQPLWHYAPTAKFPTNRMRRARFLGMAATISDHFCYVIIIEPKDEMDKPLILARMVIKLRYTNEKPPVIFS